MLRDIVVALLTVGACVALYRFGVMAVLEYVLPLTEIQVTILRRVGVTASLFVGYLLVARFYEGRTVSEFAFMPVAILVSALSGVALIGTTIVALHLLHSYQLLSFRGFALGMPIIGSICLIVIFEEVIFRGIIFRLMEKHTGTVKALMVQAVLFGVLHIFNDGTSVATVISVTLLGAFWTVIYVYTRNLWVAIANHAAWNVTIFVVGAPLSGQAEWRLSAPFENHYQGPAWLTGGAFGPEDSIINILVMACALAGLIYLARKRGAFVKGSWSPVAKA